MTGVLSKMKKILLIATLTATVMGTAAQTEMNDSILPDKRAMDINDARPMALDSTLVRDTLQRPMLTVTDAATRLPDEQILYDNRRGKWVTDPIVSPYIKINKKQKIGIDLGHLLKGFIWGNREDLLNSFVPSLTSSISCIHYLSQHLSNERDSWIDGILTTKVKQVILLKCCG